MRMEVLAALAACGFAAVAHAGTATISINEIRVDQTGADNDEYFELAGAPGTSLAGLWYVVIGDGTGGSGVVESVTDLSTYSIAADGYFSAGESTFTGDYGSLDAVLGGPNPLNFENTDNVTHLLLANFTGAVNVDLDTNDDGVLDSTPWGSIVDSIALVNGAGDRVYSSTQVGPDGTFHPGHVYRFPNFSGAWNIGQFNPVDGQDTAGSANVPTPGAIALTGVAALVAFRRRR
ncbi:MAG: hypothetical protein SFY69_11110 [Planctomycetota bacterium]|nr:hypothetical protein [Planctomycetota bacterium]